MQENVTNISPSQLSLYKLEETLSQSQKYKLWFKKRPNFPDVRIERHQSGENDERNPLSSASI